MTEIERNDSYAKYAIPIILYRTDEDGVFPSDAAYIHMKVDTEHPEGMIIGVYKTLKTDSTLFPDKNVVEIVEGDLL